MKISAKRSEKWIQPGDQSAYIKNTVEGCIMPEIQL
jgi:hypothetical protein